MKNKLLSILITAVLAAGALAGCSQGGNPSSQSEDSSGSISASSENEEQADDLLAQIQSKGEIVIATEGTWSPWTFHNESDELVGYDVEVARKVAEKLGVTATFVEVEWDGIFAGLDAQRYDIAANGVEVTPERAEKYDFSTPYGYVQTALIVRGDYDEITSFEDLAGKQTANSLGSTYMEQAESYGATVSGVDSLGETLEMVLSGRVDATLNSNVSFYNYMNVHPDANLKVAALSEDAGHVVIPVRKGDENTSLLAAINDALAELDASGELAELSEKYFGVDISRTGDDHEPAEQPDSLESAEENGIEPTTTSVVPASASGNGAPRIRFTFEGGEAVAVMDDNSAAQSLIDQLPVTVSFSDFASKEKIAYFPTDFTLEGAPGGHQAAAGDLCIYAPWGNLAVYYVGSSSASDTCIYLGKMESGLDALSAQASDFEVTVELM